MLRLGCYFGQRLPPRWRAAYLGLLGGGHAGGAVGGALRGGVVAGHGAELDACDTVVGVGKLLKGPAAEEWVGGWGRVKQ